MKLVFDIGYNHGEFSKVCRKMFPNVKIIGVEANPRLLRPWSSKDIIRHNVISDERGKEVNFYINWEVDGISTASKEFIEESRYSDKSWEEPIKVKTITLDELIAEYGTPDFIKVDVEGGEYEALKGLTRKAGVIGFEWHEELFEEVEKCVRWLRYLGYDQFGIVGIFEQGDIFPRLTYSEIADKHMMMPRNFYSWDELNMKEMIREEGKFNCGMLYAKY